MLSCNVFQIFHKNLLLSCPYYVKKVNSVKTTKYYEPKKSIGCPIFFKNVHSLKNNAFMPIFCQNTSILSKTNGSHVIFSNFVWKIPSLSCPNLVKKTSILAKLHCLWANKVNSLPFFPVFSRKINALMPIFCQKNVKFLKNTLLSSTYYVKKKHLFSQKHDALMFFFKLNKKTHAVMPIFG